MNKKNNDSGFTLIEILIAVVILAILTLPLLSAFMSSAKINHTARVQENCNTVGQLFSERLKSINLENVIDADPTKLSSFGISKITATQADPTKQYSYELESIALDANGDPYISTSVGDEYYVKVQLSPDEYVDNTDPNDNKNNNINSFNMPEISDVLNDQNFVIRRQVFQYDNSVKTMMGIADLTDIYRVVDIDVNVTNKNADGNPKTKTIDGELHNMYTEDVKASVTYRSLNDSSKKSETKTFNIGSYEIAGDINESSYKNIYLFYNSFGNRTNDKINININNETLMLNDEKDKANNLIDNKKIRFYLVEQQANETDTSLNKLKFDSVHLKIDGNMASFGTAGVDVNTLDLGTKKIFDLYTNTESLQNTKKNNSLTQQTGESDSIGYLYNMKVNVWVGNKSLIGAPYLTMTSTKKN